MGANNLKSIQLASGEELKCHLIDFYKDISYDGSPEFKCYIPKGIWFTLFQDEEVAGLINLELMNNVMWSAHVMIHPSFRKKGSEEWAIQAASYMREHLGAKKILAITPYMSAMRYAERAGFKYLTNIKNSILKNGKVMDQYMLELELGDLK